MPPKESKVYVGIDPGASGALVSLHAGRVRIAEVGKMIPDDVWCWLKDTGSLAEANGGGFAVIEQVGGYVGGTTFAAGSSAMFNFGHCCGMLEGFLIASRIPHEKATPQRWQRALGIPRRGKEQTGTQWKNILKARAQSLFPKEKVTLAVADALLIAEYCRRKMEGIL